MTSIGEALLSLAGWLITAAVQSSILILVLLPLAWIAGRWSTTAAYGVWLLGLIKVFLPTTLAIPATVGSWGFGTMQLHLLALFADPVRALHTDQTFGPEVGVLSTQVQTTLHLLPAGGEVIFAGGLLLAWAMGVLVTMLRVAECQWRLREHLQATRRVQSGPIHEELSELCALLGLRVPRLYLSASASSPFLCSLHNPAIVLPAHLPGDLSRAQLRMVLLHELVHLKRGDLFVCWMQVLAECLMWFNPLVIFASRRLEEAREWCVDAEVVRLTRGGAAAYGEAILSVVESMDSMTPALALAGRGLDASVLERRIRRLVEFQPETFRQRLVALSLVALLGVQLLPMAPAEAPSRPRSIQTQTVVQT